MAGRESDSFVNEIIKNPLMFYRSPDEVLKDLRLSAAQKEQVLDTWERHQLSLVRAGNQNKKMQEAARDAAKVSDLLRQVRKAKSRLD